MTVTTPATITLKAQAIKLESSIWDDFRATRNAVTYAFIHSSFTTRLCFRGIDVRTTGIKLDNIKLKVLNKAVELGTVKINIGSRTLEMKKSALTIFA